MVLYLAALIYIVFFVGRRHELELIWSNELINYIPLKQTIQWFQSLGNTPNKEWKEFYSNLIGNILLFIPFPFFLRELFNITKKSLILKLGIASSILIEILQFLWKIGVPDIDDVLLNVSGVLIGNFLWKSIIKSRYNKDQLYNKQV